MNANPGEDWAPNKNLGSQGPEGPMETSRAGNLVLTTIAKNTGGKRWTPDTTPDKWETQPPCQRMTGGNNERENL